MRYTFSAPAAWLVNLRFFCLGFLLLTSSCCGGESTSATPSSLVRQGEQFLEKRGGVQAVISNLVSSMTVSSYNTFYESETEQVIRDRDGVIKQEHVQDRKRIRSLLVEAIDSSTIHEAFINVTTNIFTLPELEALNRLSEEEYETFLQIASKKYFIEKEKQTDMPDTPFAEESPPVRLTEKEEQVLRDLSAPAMSAIDKIRRHGVAFNRAIAAELNRAHDVVRQTLDSRE